MTKLEKWRLARLPLLGCIVCRLQGLGDTPAQVHHLLNGNRRIGHLFTIPLCYLHHQSNRNDAQCTSRHPGQRRQFEARYGTEQYLLDETNKLLGDGTKQ